MRRSFGKYYVGTRHGNTMWSRKIWEYWTSPNPSPTLVETDLLPLMHCHYDCGQSWNKKQKQNLRSRLIYLFAYFLLGGGGGG